MLNYISGLFGPKMWDIIKQIALHAHSERAMALPTKTQLMSTFALEKKKWNGTEP